MVVVAEGSSSHRTSAYCSVPLCNNVESEERKATPIRHLDLAVAGQPTLNSIGAKQPAIASFGPGSFAEVVSPVHEEKLHPSQTITIAEIIINGDVGLENVPDSSEEEEKSQGSNLTAQSHLAASSSGFDTFVRPVSRRRRPPPEQPKANIDSGIQSSGLNTMRAPMHHSQQPGNVTRFMQSSAHNTPLMQDSVTEFVFQGSSDSRRITFGSNDGMGTDK